MPVFVKPDGLLNWAPVMTQGFCSLLVGGRGWEQAFTGVLVGIFECALSAWRGIG